MSTRTPTANPLRLIHRLFSDTTDMLLFRSSRIPNVAAYSAQWTAAVVLLFIGAVLNTRHDLHASLPIAAAAGAVLVGLVTFWASMDEEQAQRTYVISVSLGVVSAISSLWAGQIIELVLSVWMIAAYFVFMNTRTKRNNQ